VGLARSKKAFRCPDGVRRHLQRLPERDALGDRSLGRPVTYGRLKMSRLKISVGEAWQHAPLSAESADRGHSSYLLRGPSPRKSRGVVVAHAGVVEPPAGLVVWWLRLRAEAGFLRGSR
jgi:hypothetical protein